MKQFVPEASQPRPVQVTVKNPLVLDRIVEAMQAGHGRNMTEAAENLIIAGSDAMNRKARSNSQPREPAPVENKPTAPVGASS
jgi:hypothetical protein